MLVLEATTNVVLAKYRKRVDWTENSYNLGTIPPPLCMEACYIYMYM